MNKKKKNRSNKKKERIKRKDINHGQKERTNKAFHRGI